MSIRVLFQDGSLICDPKNALGTAPSIQDPTEIEHALKTAQREISDWPVEVLLDLLDAARNSWSNRDSPVQEQFQAQGLTFLLAWMRKSQLSKVLDMSLRGNAAYLDGFQPALAGPGKWCAQSRGIVVHWLSGNVPMLGLISLFQSILCKNANLLKVSSAVPEIIPFLLSSLKDVEVLHQGARYSWKTLLRSISVVYVESNDLPSQNLLSRMADARIAWGGREAVESVSKLQKKVNCEDIIFGPRISMFVVGKENLGSAEQARPVARGIANDVHVFEQRGCNSPHIGYIQNDGAISPEAFLEILGEEMESALSRFPHSPTQAGDAGTLLQLRAHYHMKGKALHSKNLDWSLLYQADERGMPTIAWHRTVYLRAFDTLGQVSNEVTPTNQSVGCALSADNHESFARLASRNGADRFPKVGAMSLYDTPWDGNFLADRLVRWVKL